MSDYVIVRINEKLIPEFQINYNANSPAVHCSIITSWDQIKVSLNQELILMLSGVLVFSKEVMIPSKNEDIIKQSIPFALEEELATEIGVNHFAYNKSQENLFNVCVVAKGIMQKILILLSENKLSCKKIYSEIYSLPASNNTISILTTGDYFIINNNNTGTTVNNGIINHYVKNAEPKDIVLYSDQTIKLDDSKITYKHVDSALFQSKVLINNKAVNLFQGEYDQDTERKNGLSPWKKLKWLSLALLLSWCFINFYQLWYLTGKIEIVQTKQQILLKKLIHNVSQSELNDPYSAIQSRLKYVATNQTNNSANGFMQSLIYVGLTLNLHKQVKISSLRQRENKLEINVLAINVNDLNLFQASLKKISLARHIKTGTRNSSKDGIRSVITMEML